MEEPSGEIFATVPRPPSFVTYAFVIGVEARSCPVPRSGSRYNRRFPESGVPCSLSCTMWESALLAIHTVPVVSIAMPTGKSMPPAV